MTRRPGCANGGADEPAPDATMNSDSHDDPAGRGAAQPGLAVSLSFRPLDKSALIEKTRRNLPHWRQAGCMYYVTFRLADSLPQTLLKQCQAERALWLKLNPRPWSVAVLREYARRFQVTFFAGHTALVEVLYGASAREATWDDRAVLDG